MVLDKVVEKVRVVANTQGTQGNSGNFQVEENLRETQGSIDFF